MTIVAQKPSEGEISKEVAEIKKATKKVTQSRKAAKAYLKKSGFITESENLTSRYKR